MYGVNGKQLTKQYKEYLSDYRQWKQREHAPIYTLYASNLGERLSMDETCLSQGELYTIVTNKAAHQGKGSLVAIIRGTKSEEVIYWLCKIPLSMRNQVKEITIDLSPSMQLIAQQAFPSAVIVSDRFHVQKLMNEAISDLRVDYRWQAIDQENAEIELAREVGRKFTPHVFENGDTRRQLLARSRHIVMKHRSKWTDSQRRRAEILFEHYPAIAEAYEVSMELTDIYNKTRIKKSKLREIEKLSGEARRRALHAAKERVRGVALMKLARWYERVDGLNCKFFNSVITTMQNNYGSIVRYFDNRSTNASAESFNAKVKAFRSQFRGVRDIPFFLFRLSSIFA